MRRPEGLPTKGDETRIKDARERVRLLMADGDWHSAEELRRAGGSEGLRRFREVRVGRTWQKRNLGNGVWAYKLVA